MNEKSAYILVLDSGLGGLSVLDAITKTLPSAPLIYVADNAAFPYGNRSAEDIFARAKHVIEKVARTHTIALIVIACNTLSTLCLESLRAAMDYSFVGTVPAVKIAARESITKRFTLLATPNTVRSDYTKQLIAMHAKDCLVDVVGAAHLAEIAEAWLLGESVDETRIAQEIAPCFYDDAHGKTDAIVLGCTHYPFLLHHMQKASPWQVIMIDPSLAIARQTARLWQPVGAQGDLLAYVTKSEKMSDYETVFARFGFYHLKTLSA